MTDELACAEKDYIPSFMMRGKGSKRNGKSVAFYTPVLQRTARKALAGPFSV